MQLEDKLVENHEAARAELQQREDTEAHGQDKLPEANGEAVHEASVQLRGKLLGAIRMVLQDEWVEISELQLPAHEARALTALQVAVTGHGDLGQFIYAYDRRDLLEQALAVLQPNLVEVDSKSARELAAQLADLTSKVGELRGTLTNLEEAQDELIEGQLHRPEQVAQPPGDKPKPKPKPSDPDAPRPPTTLTGPELPAGKPAATTLVGPDLPAAKPAPTTLAGPELPEARPAPTTLVGPDLPEARPAPTTLVGPDLPDAAPPPTTLGDPAELAEQAKLPWWRRPFG